MKSKNLDILKQNNINVPDYEVIENVEELKAIGKSESFEEAFVNVATGEEV